MSQKQLVSEEIAKVIDIFEQIESINKMIELHKGGDDFMVNQYKHRKEKFLKELRELLKEFNISPTDLAA